MGGTKSNAAALIVLILGAMIALAVFAFSEDSAVEVLGVPLGGVEGTAYTGYLKNGLASGAGILEFSDGAAYYGSFSEGRFNGKAVYVAVDGSTHEGTFEEGQLLESE